ncbi:RxLR effector protein [Phytophthora megakarya]|uniref:RxLR effector protein n=1 Tax=Phytophthora megakarya TaxID=4795 RepID=A0A225WNG8_9STRA|nr:RxLR effector protein [Phytophthora megakarya]
MSLSQVAIIAVASFLLVSEALMTPVSSHVKIQSVVSQGGSNQRLLRGRHGEYDNDSEESNKGSTNSLRSTGKS